jgi:N-sulfoglucosamine sulfohydrolase
MKTDRPNVLLIVSEDNGPHLGCYGDPYIATPHLDRLASEGVRFTRAYTTQAVCSPGRASILTGLYPHQNGQIGLATHKYAMYESFPNIPSLLKEAGYRTGIIGKLHVNPESAFPFDYWWNDRDYISFANRDVDQIAERASGFMHASDTPFFLMVNYPDAHLPFHRQQFGVPETPYEADEVVPPPFVGIETPRLRAHTADYYNCISRLDSGVGLLLEALQRAGKAEETLVIFTTDHGPQLSRGKTSIYEAGLRVPYIMRWPGRVKKGLVRDELLSHVDILPTIMEAAGLTCPEIVAGQSVLPLIRGASPAWREYLFAEWGSGGPTIYFPQRSVRDGRYKLIVNLLQDRASPSRGYSGPGQQWTPGATLEEIAGADEPIRRAYDLYAHPPAEELYDLENDPWEFDNLAGRPECRAVQQRLRDRLQSWQIETHDALIDPACLERLTKEHDAIVEAYYQDGPWGASRDYEWGYRDYLYG